MLYFIVLSFLFCSIFLYLTRDITFFSNGTMQYNSSCTDQEKMLTSAKVYNFFSWPSKMHTIKNNRAQLREFWFIFAAIFCKIFRKNDEFINVFLSTLSHFLSCILIFLIANKFFNYNTGLIVALLYLTSLWTYQVVIWFGHVIFSQFWFLLSVYFLTFYNPHNSHYNTLLSFISGLFVAVCFYSSSSSRKFPPITFFIFLYFNIFEINSLKFFDYKNYIFYLILLLTLGVLFFIYFFTKSKIKNFIILKTEKQKTEEVKIELKKIYMKNFNNFFLLLIVIIFLLKILIFSVEFPFIFIKNFVFFLLGLSLVSLYILGPNFLANIARYGAWLESGSSWGNHFASYPKNFFGRIIPKDFIAPRIWILNYFNKICPLIFYLYIFSALSLFFIKDSIYSKFMYLFLSLLPIIILEITKSPRIGRAYHPSLISFLILISYSFYNLSNNNEEIIYIFYMLIFINFVISVYIFFDDVLPSRMAPAYLHKFLKKNKINSISTYKSPFNDGFISPMKIRFPKSIRVNFSKSIKKSKDRYFVVPPTTSKSVSCETISKIINNGDFRDDFFLNSLLDSKQIEKVSIKKFKTFGSSKFFTAESEVTGYRDLCLNEINYQDRYLGLAWVIDTKLIKRI
jgi:hypothetical protein